MTLLEFKPYIRKKLYLEHEWFNIAVIIETDKEQVIVIADTNDSSNWATMKITYSFKYIELMRSD